MQFDVKVTKSKSAADCGAACMVSLLAYYGIDVTLDEMIQECKITVNGCNGRNLKEAAAAHGLEMIAWKEKDADFPVIAPDAERRGTNVATLHEDRPAICWWKYNHFLILCGLDERGRVILMNPARGKYTVSQSLFNSFYSGVSFTIGEPQWAPGEEPAE